MKKVKIVATIGPSTSYREMIEELILMGVDVFRLNFSHADHETHKKTISTIRDVSQKLNTHTAVLQDIGGPKIRIGEIDGVLELKRGDILKLAKKDRKNDIYTLTISHPEIIDRLKEGEYVFFADGSIRTMVKKKHKDYAELFVKNSGVLSSRKGVNFPHTNLKISAITNKDVGDLIFGAEEGVDIVAVSFVNSKDDIETKKAVENINEIIKASDGVMVARGDLGIEVGLEKVPVIQKKIIKKANALGKPVVVATQMLLNMVNSPFPTRAEVSDVANALLDGADAVMLSDETTVGRYPKKAVETLVNIILETQNIYLYYKKYESCNNDAIAASVADLCNGINPKAVVSVTSSGETAKNIAKYRPKTPILAVSHTEDILRKLSLVWGVEPFFVVEKSINHEDMINIIKKTLNKQKTAEKSDKIILTMGSIIGQQGTTNMIRILDV